jgi:hypothetical protein
MRRKTEWDETYIRAFFWVNTTSITAMLANTPISLASL